MVTDKIIDSFHVWGCEEGVSADDYWSDSYGTYENQWKKKQNEINNFLDKYNIVQEDVVFYQNTSIFLYENSDIETHRFVMHKTDQDLDENGYPICGNCIVLNISLIDFENKKLKTILNREMYIEDGLFEGHYENYNIQGYFFSPDKKRVTIALSKVSYGFEGELDVSLEFIGCSLNPKTFK